MLAVSGFMPWKGGLIVTSAPDIPYLKDTDGDGKADLRKVLYTGFPKVKQEARITNPRLSVDNWIYCSNNGSDGRITSPDHPEMPPITGVHRPTCIPSRVHRSGGGGALLFASSGMTKTS